MNSQPRKGFVILSPDLDVRMIEIGVDPVEAAQNVRAKSKWPDHVRTAPAWLCRDGNYEFWLPRGERRDG